MTTTTTTIPLYLNAVPPSQPYDSRYWVRETFRWLGIRRFDPEPDPSRLRHSFRLLPGGLLLGTVQVARGAVVLPASRCSGRSVLVVTLPGDDGQVVQLSAADVAEQATVGGCGLAWASGRPEAWRGVRAAG